MQNRIQEWYNGRSLLVTGGTGFMGKVLVEKILRCLPGVEKVYIIIREKRGVLPQDRLKNILQLPIFDKIRSAQPELLKKIVGFDGDILQEDFGLKPSNIKELQKNVSVVFHNAASLKLEADMAHAIQFNTRGTKYAMEFCLKLPKLDVVQHLSTAFCHVDVDHLEEKIYPSPHDPEDLIQMVNWLDKEALDQIQQKLLGVHPNCYTYSKRLAETIVNRYNDKLPLVILRPSIVVPALYEPIPGWVDSLNGPIGLLVAAGKGVIRTMMIEGGNHAEVIPVDIAINAMIVAQWERVEKTQKSDEVPVYNITTSNNTINITWKDVIEGGKKVFYSYPYDFPVIWYPDGGLHTNKYVHYILAFLLHTVPAYLIDFLMFMFFQPRFMIHIHNRIKLGLELLQYFTMRLWNFKNNKILHTTSILTENELDIFYLANIIEYDLPLYYKNAILGSRQYCLKDPLSSLPRARRILRFLYVLHTVTRCFLVYWLSYFVLWLFNSQDYLRPSTWTTVLGKQSIH